MEFAMGNPLRISEPQNHRCCYCGHSIERHKNRRGRPLPPNAITRDHIIPKSQGGTNADNLLAACNICNFLRGDMDAYAFFNLLQRLFRRNPRLRRNWHSLSKETIANLRVRFLLTHERQLRGLGIRDISIAFAHAKLIEHHGHTLRATRMRGPHSFS